jgi:hypothetical protein
VQFARVAPSDDDCSPCPGVPRSLIARITRTAGAWICPHPRTCALGQDHECMCGPCRRSVESATAARWQYRCRIACVAHVHTEPLLHKRLCAAQPADSRSARAASMHNINNRRVTSPQHRPVVVLPISSLGIRSIPPIRTQDSSRTTLRQRLVIRSRVLRECHVRGAADDACVRTARTVFTGDLAHERNDWYIRNRAAARPRRLQRTC